MTTKVKKVVKPKVGDPTTKELTPMTKVKVKDIKPEPQPLKIGDTFKFIKDGQVVYYTRSTANVVFQRGMAQMVIPKGSEYIPPKGSKCDGCG